MEALVEVQRWLFSSLFCLALSLSFPPFLPFSSVLPELLSSQINSPPCFLFSSKILPPRFVPLFLKKSSPLSSGSVLSPVFISSRGRGSPYPVQAQGIGGRGMGLLIFVMVGGMGLLFLH
jgi:hypothetical protein